MEAPETKTITLRQPLKLGSESWHTLDLREPTAGELVKAQQEGARNGPAASTIVLIALVTGVPKPVIEKLPAREFREADEFLAGFLAPSPAKEDGSSAD